jgi:uncharacterized protein YbjT (DUF2867 family)
MRVFVAGATGAIGKQLVPRLVAAGHEVHGMTRRQSKQAMLHELGAVLRCELRGASNAKAKRELGWQPAHPSWRQGFAT